MLYLLKSIELEVWTKWTKVIIKQNKLKYQKAQHNTEYQ